MAPKPPNRQKAAHIPDLAILQSVLYGAVCLPEFAPKVVLAKVRKLKKQGYIEVRSGRLRVTRQGQERIRELV